MCAVASGDLAELRRVESAVRGCDIGMRNIRIRPVDDSAARVFEFAELEPPTANRRHRR